MKSSLRHFPFFSKYLGNYLDFPNAIMDFSIPYQPRKDALGTIFKIYPERGLEFCRSSSEEKSNQGYLEF